jgi:hypothetical protein
MFRAVGARRPGLSRRVIVALLITSVLVVSSGPVSAAGVDERDPTTQEADGVGASSTTKPSNLAGMAVGAVLLGGWASIGVIALERQRRRRSRGLVDTSKAYTEPHETLPDVASSVPQPETGPA